MLNDAFVVCRKCNKKVHPSELRKESVVSSVMICSTCYNKAKELSISIAEIKKEAATNSKAKFYCEACGFKFTRSKTVFSKSCPYCNKESVKQVDVKLIKEIKDF